MRLPAAAIAAAFACGILLGLHPAVARNAASILLLCCSVAIIAVLVFTGILFVRIGRLYLAAVASLLSWVMLGFLGVCVAEQPRDPNHVISLIEQGRIPLKTPLRWQGQMRDEPARLPWATDTRWRFRASSSRECCNRRGANSTTPEFLAAVQPRFGIISAGEDNPYRHPSPELLERLEEAGVRILRTD